MRLFKLLLVLLIVAAIAVAYLAMAPFGPSEETFVNIAPGTPTAGMASQLQQAGIIRSALVFEAMKAVHGGVLHAGEYRFDHPVPMSEVYARLRRGDVYTRTLVIPEGSNIFDIAVAVEKAGLGSSADFLAAEKSNGQLIHAWNPTATSLEGFLFPDTYKFSRRAKPVDMLATMVRRFGTQAGKLGIAPAEAARVVTMASLVEREVHIPSERATVAGVFENRLAAGMPLQTDPSVVYGSMLRGTWTGVIHRSELQSDSPYNTYTHTGLPPGPICNPGVAALKAALEPMKSDYLYFVATAGGATRFARTIEEHNANVAEYRAETGQAPAPPVPVETTPVSGLVHQPRGRSGGPVGRSVHISGRARR